MKDRLIKLVKFTKDYEVTEDIILRDHLALERTKLANERTLLSYIRTALYLLLGGIAFLGMSELGEYQRFGYVSLGLSALLVVIGIVRFVQLSRHLKRMYGE